MEENPMLPGVSGSTPERKFHPIANVFPLLRGAEFDALVDDIRRHGLREPILCDADGRIIDGRNRYRACLEAGIEPRFTQWHAGGHLPELALSLNLRRRHLNESQRAMVAARLSKWLVPKGQGAQPDTRSANLRTGQKARYVAAELLNVSCRSVDHACRVLHDGSSELIAAVESGGLAVSLASRLAALPKPDQATALAGGAQAAARKARELRARTPAAGTGGASSFSFGVFGETTLPSAANLPARAAALLWVDAEGLTGAIAALRARGYLYLTNSD
jgi:hypothetical protein